MFRWAKGAGLAISPWHGRRTLWAGLITLTAGLVPVVWGGSPLMAGLAAGLAIGAIAALVVWLMTGGAKD